MRKLLCVVALVGMMSAPVAVQAQMTAGPALGYHTDAESIGVGGFLSIPVPQLSPGFAIVPNFIWWFPDAGSLFEVNGDVAYNFPVAADSPVAPFAFAGLNIMRASVDIGNQTFSNTDVGLNLGGGVQFNAGSLAPIAGAKFEIQDGTGFVIFGAIGFAIGGGA
jgi:hypothetical protein